MKKHMTTIIFTLMSVTLLSANLQAKECYKANTIDVQWVSYKTMAKVGVGGNFSKTKLSLSTSNATSLQAMLQGATVSLNLANIDAHMALKNSNIAQYFVANLASKKITAKVVSQSDTKLKVQITLNNISQTIPMAYKVKNSHIIASGVIDALDFKLVPALRVLNKNVSGHKNKGWNDISISFDMPYTTSCK